MSEYIFPSASRNVSDDFAAHVRRKSVNPGTDYYAGRGLPIVAVKAGRVTLVDPNTDGSGGRMVFIDHGDGSQTQYLHLNAIYAGLGQQLAQGQVLGTMGGSAYGSESGVGVHLHLALKINGKNVDFEKFVGKATSPTQAPDTATRWDQERLKVWGYNIVVDGIRGPQTIAAIRDFQAKRGLTVDGVAGPLTDAVLATNPVPTLVVDGTWGPATTKALQSRLGVVVDGVFGRQSITALQTRIGVKADGEFGPQSKKALQRYLGVKDDGVIGPVTVKALQARLNAGTF